jgi:SMC interacting uncharacterized protein involved in chromosome segregation
MIMICSLIIAQSSQDISSVPADFVKNWWMMFGFAAVLFMQWRNGQTQRREVSGKIVTTEEQTPASIKEVEDLREDLESFIQQNRAEHQAAITAGQQRVVNLSEVLNKETSELEDALDKLRDGLSHKIDSAFAALHAKVDPLAAHSASASALIDQIDKRLSRLELDHSEAVSKLHNRIDDAMTKYFARKA